MCVIDNDRNGVHKKKLLSMCINKGVSFPEKDGNEELDLNGEEKDEHNLKHARAKKKSIDRECRAMSSERRGNQTDSALHSVVSRSFNRCRCNESDDPHSGADRHNSDDYCAVVIKEKLERGTNVSKDVHLVT